MPFNPIFAVSNTGVAGALYWAQEKMSYPCVLVQASLENSSVANPEKGRIMLVKGWKDFDGGQQHFELATGYACIGENITWTGEIVITEAMMLVGELKHEGASTYHRLEGLYKPLPERIPK